MFSSTSLFARWRLLATMIADHIGALTITRVGLAYRLNCSSIINFKCQSTRFTLSDASMPSLKQASSSAGSSAAA
jgi:hypothetical protein